MVALSTIPNRPAAISLSGTEEIPMQQGGTVVRATVAQLLALAANPALGSGVFAALGVNVGSPGSVVVQGGGPMFFQIHSFTTAYNVTATDFVVIATSAGAPTYPTAVGVTGQAYIFINATGSPITPATTSGQTINGSSPAAVTAHTAQRVISDGANWQTW